MKGSAIELLDVMLEEISPLTTTVAKVKYAIKYHTTYNRERESY